MTAPVIEVKRDSIQSSTFREASSEDVEYGEIVISPNEWLFENTRLGAGVDKFPNGRDIAQRNLELVVYNGSSHEKLSEE